VSRFERALTIRPEDRCNTRVPAGGVCQRIVMSLYNSCREVEAHLPLWKGESSRSVDLNRGRVRAMFGQYVRADKKVAFWLTSRTPPLITQYFQAQSRPRFSHPRAGCSNQGRGAQTFRRMAKVQPVRAMDSIHHGEDHQRCLPAKVVAYHVHH